MYFAAYNPTIHDPYLYSPGNTGYPIGLNPNCLLYDARESYKAISVRYRDWIRTNPSYPLPPGTDISLYPNYYNNNHPLYFKITDKFLSCSTHFTYFFHWDYPNNYFCTDPYKINPPPPQFCSPNFAAFENYREGGQTGINSVRFWNSGFTGFTDISGIEHMYDHVSNSSEVGLSFGVYDTNQGATFYKITRYDHSLMKKKNYSSSNNFGSATLSVVHPLSILTKEQIKNIDDYNISSTTYRIPVTDVFFWGGNDTIAPVDYIEFNIRKILKSTDFNSFLPSITEITGAVLNGSGFVGDSSGLLLYKKNNKLYSLGHVYTTGSFSINNENYGSVFGPMHAGTFYPSMKYFIDIVGITAGFYLSNDNSKKIARTWHFDNIKTGLENIKNKLESII
jgi:hypothetical protein